MRIDALEIDDAVVEKIESKHGVYISEVEEACLNSERHVRRGRDGLYKVFSQTAAGRYLLAVLVQQGGGIWKIVTAREMTDVERRLYIRHAGN